MLIHEFIVLEEDILRNMDLIENYRALVKTNECVLVSDSVILYNAKAFAAVHTYTQTDKMMIDMRGLDYYGVTIIPNRSLPKLIDVLYHLRYKHNESRGLKKLLSLCKRARIDGRAIVHYGI